MEDAHHLCQSPSGDDVASVDEAIQVTGRLLDLLTHVIFAVEVEDIRYKIKGVLVILNLSVEACQIEAVGEVFLVDFTEIFVAA